MALQDHWGFGGRYMDSPLLQCLIQKGITQMKASNAKGDGTSSFEVKKVRLAIKDFADGVKV